MNEFHEIKLPARDCRQTLGYRPPRFTPVRAPASNGFSGALSTLLLFVSTLLLVIVTYLLAKVTRDDGLHRRREATTSAWMKIRADIDMPDMNDLDREAIIDAGVKIRPLLRQLEAFSTCVNLKVYDIGTFNRISGGWFVRNFDKIKPYIMLKHLELPHHPYNEMISLNEDLLRLRSRRSRRHSVRERR